MPTRSFRLRGFWTPKTRFKSLDEYYRAINELREQLEADGHAEEAQRLKTLMHSAWTTGSELLGELMLVLRSMKGDYSAELKEEIRDCEEFAHHHRKILALD